MAKTVAELSRETMILQKYIEEQEPGAELSFDKIARDTKIPMTGKNKAKLRCAMRRAKREYSSVHNFGVKLADSKSTMDLLTHKLVKIDRCVKRGENSQKNLQEQFFHSLDSIEQKNILFIGAVFGAIRVAAENGRVIYSKNPHPAVDGEVKLQIPKLS